MVDVIVYKLLPYGLVFIHDKSLGLKMSAKVRASVKVRVMSSNILK